MTEKKCIAFVGGGGKTSLIWKTAEKFVKEGKKVIVTTTTHMAVEHNRPFVLDGEKENISGMLEKYGYVLTASFDEKKKKLSSLDKNDYGILYNMCDILLVEADGARGMPFKVPMKWEPVIPEPADMVVAVAGLDALGKSIKEAAYNPYETALFLQKSPDTCIEKEDFIKIFSSPEGLRKGVGNREYRVYLNKTDVLEENSPIPDFLREELKKKQIIATSGSLLF